MMDDEDTGIDVKAAFEVAVDIGTKLTRSIERQDALLRRLDAVTLVQLRPTVSAFCPTPTASFVLDFGTPAQGTFWEVRKVVVGGLEFTTATAGTAGLYVSGTATVDGAGLNNAEDYAASLPSPTYYSSGQMYVRANEHLFLVIFGGTAGQQYVANALVRVSKDAVPEIWTS